MAKINQLGTMNRKPNFGQPSNFFLPVKSSGYYENINCGDINDDWNRKYTEPKYPISFGCNKRNY